MVDRVAVLPDVFQHGGKQRPLLLGRRLRHKDDKARVQRLSAIEAAKIDGVMGDEYKVALKDP